MNQIRTHQQHNKSKSPIFTNCYQHKSLSLDKSEQNISKEEVVLFIFFVFNLISRLFVICFENFEARFGLKEKKGFRNKRLDLGFCVDGMKILS